MRIFSATGAPCLPLLLLVLLVSAAGVLIPVPADTVAAAELRGVCNATGPFEQAACTPQAGPLPPCTGDGDDTDGCWSADLAAADAHVRGAGTSEWPRLWLPRTCQTTRHSGTTLGSPGTCGRLRALSRNRSDGYRLLLMGDSGSARGSFCLLFALLVRGTERRPPDLAYGDPDTVGCGGLFPKASRGRVTYRHKEREREGDANRAQSAFNDTHYLRFVRPGPGWAQKG